MMSLVLVENERRLHDLRLRTHDFGGLDYRTIARDLDFETVCAVRMTGVNLVGSRPKIVGIDPYRLLEDRDRQIAELEARVSELRSELGCANDRARELDEKELLERW
jgi:hypothetical protein